MSYELNPKFKINSNHCQNAQNFCSTNQKVSQLFDVNKIFSQIQQQTLITPQIFKEIKDLLQEVHDYGAIGEEKDPTKNNQNKDIIRNPEQTKINDIEIPKNLSNNNELEKITVKYYNKILDAIDNSTKLEDNTILTYQDFVELKNLISSYELNSKRCNICNTNKNCDRQGIKVGCCEYLEWYN